MRLPFLRSKKTDDAVAPPPPKRRAAAAAAEPLRAGDDELVAAARTRARRRLVGALVLLAVGVIGFPILFETQPRPLPLDTPIEAPRREANALPPPATALPPRSRPAPLPVLPADAGNETAAAPPASAPAPAPAPRAESTIAPVVAHAAPAAASKPAAAPPKPAPSAAAAAPTAPAPSANGRFVVQVGAYTDASTLRDARAKVEKLGMKTYTQVVENDAGKRTRVRLGPFATREEADAAAAKVKRAGLPAAILAL